MNVPIEIQIRKYEAVRDEVRKHSSSTWEQVIQLCSLVPDRVEIKHVWQFGRDKPCWSNIKVNIGERIASDILKSSDFGSFKIIASDDWEIIMRKPGRQWKTNENFELRGKSVQEFIYGLSRGGLSSYLWRLYAIRNLALALASDSIVQGLVSDLSAKGISTDLKKWTETFCQRVGMGWGIVTAYHLMTDLGLTPKPDIHLKRSAIRMGLLAPKIPSSYGEEFFSKVSDHEIVLAVIELSKLVVPTAHPQKSQSTLREVDKILMEWSRQKLSHPL